MTTRNETAKLRCVVAERNMAIAELRCEVSELRALTDILGDTIRENYLSLGVRRDDHQILAEMLAKIEVRLGRPMRSQLTYGEAVYEGVRNIEQEKPQDVTTRRRRKRDDRDLVLQ